MTLTEVHIKTLRALHLADTVLFLIRLADRFDVAELMQRCEEHLLSAKDVHIAGKLLAADELNLRMTRARYSYEFMLNMELGQASLWSLTRKG